MKQFLYIALFISFYSCTSEIKYQFGSIPSKFMSNNPQDSIDSVRKVLLDKAIPVFGYRFIISGDFDGDGKTEQLTEHYFSKLLGKETEKFYTNTQELGDDIDLAMYKQPFSFVLSDNKNIDTLKISDGLQLFGIAFLKNEGDLNGDGTDEISYVVDWADWSNLNTWHIVTYKNKTWQELYSFPIWDWQLPELPSVTNQYGLFGLENKHISLSDDSVNQVLEQNLKTFDGLVKKVGKRKIRVTYRTDDAEEKTKVVKLN